MTLSKEVATALMGSKYRFLYNLHRERNASFECVLPKPKPLTKRRKSSVLPLNPDQKAIDVFRSVIAASPSGAKKKGVHFNVLDATFGTGRHTKAILALCGDVTRVCATDIDPMCVADGQKVLDMYGSRRFRYLPPAKMSTLHGLFGENIFDGIVVHPGANEKQFRDPERGFDLTTPFDGPCTLRYNNSPENRDAESAMTLLNTLTFEGLMGLFFDDARLPEPIAKDLARVVISRRPLKGTFDVRDVIESVCGAFPDGEEKRRRSRALQVLTSVCEMVNNDREELKHLLSIVPEVLTLQGRCVLVLDQAWQFDLVREVEQKHPFLSSPQIRTKNGMVVLERHGSMAFDKKLSARMHGPSPQASVLEQALAKGPENYEAFGYPADRFRDIRANGPKRRL